MVYASWWKVKCKQQRDMCWNLNYVVKDAFNADRMKPAASCLECVPGSTTQLQLQRNLDEKMCGEDLKEHCQRGEQAQCILFWSVWLFPACNYWVWFSVLLRALSISFKRKFVNWSFQAVLYNCFYMQFYQEKLETVHAYLSCMTCSLRGFAME